ncbi:MAG: hypothetical protein ACM3JD_05010, partial [Rudaea sp.]
EREAAELKLLAQAAAQMQVASALLDAAQAQAAAPSAVTRGASTVFLQQTLNDAAALLETPVGSLEAGTHQAVRGGLALRPSDLAGAKSGLEGEADTSVSFITREAGRVGGEVLRDLLLLDAATVLEGVRLVSKDAASALDQLIAGAGNLIIQLATSAIQLLVQAYQWVLSLLGKDTADQAISQANNWLSDLRDQSGQGDSGGPFGVLVTNIYQPDAVDKDVATWVEAGSTAADTLNKTADTVKGLADKFRARTAQVEKLMQAVALVRKVPVLAAPQGQALIAAVNLGLLGYVIYTGYDHVDSGSVVFFNRFHVNIPNRVEGVRATVQKALGISDAAQPAAPASPAASQPGQTPPA